MSPLTSARRDRVRVRATYVSVLGLVAVTLLACRREPAAPTPVLVLDARDHAPDLAAPASPTAPPTIIAAGPAAGPAAGTIADGEYSAVEISGGIELPPGAPPKERLMVYITTGDCLNDGSPLLRRLPISDNRTFFAAVMAPYGSMLSVCAAAEPTPGKPAHLYGRAKEPLPVQKLADQAFGDVKITLSENPPRSFPTQLAR